MVLSKNYLESDKSRSHPNAIFIVCSKQKNKTENIEYHSIFISFKVRCTQDIGVLFFPYLGHEV